MKAVILVGGKQYIVAEKDKILVDLIADAKEGGKLEFTPLMLVDGQNSKVGTPGVKDAKVGAKVVEPLVKADKVTAIRFEAKKRVNKTRGHRQQYTKIEITSIK